MYSTYVEYLELELFLFLTFCMNLRNVSEEASVWMNVQLLVWLKRNHLSPPFPGRSNDEPVVLAVIAASLAPAEVMDSSC